MEEITENTDKKHIEKPWLFQPGQSGNPAGKPPGTLSMIGLLKQELENIPDELKDKPIEERKNWARKIVKKWLENAGDKGEQKAIDSIVDRTDGPVKQAVELSGGVEVKIELNDKEKELLQLIINNRLKEI